MGVEEELKGAGGKEEARKGSRRDKQRCGSALEGTRPALARLRPCKCSAASAGGSGAFVGLTGSTTTHTRARLRFAASSRCSSGVGGAAPGKAQCFPPPMCDTMRLLALIPLLSTRRSRPEKSDRLAGL
jgi:hypothetical protein